MCVCVCVCVCVLFVCFCKSIRTPVHDMAVTGGRGYRPEESWLECSREEKRIMICHTQHFNNVPGHVTTLRLYVAFGTPTAFTQPI